MSTTPLLSLPRSPSPSTPQSHQPSPLSPTPAPTPAPPSVPSASTSGPVDIVPPLLPSPSRLHRRRPPVVPLTPDEEAAAARVSARYVTPCPVTVKTIQSKISYRVASRLTADHISALFPDVDSPFRDMEDIVDRLLPYHVFQHPEEDLLKAGKGKRKATETEILRSEVAGAPSSCRMLSLCPWWIQKRSLHWSASSAEENWRNAFVVLGRNRARHAPLYTLATAISLTARH